MEQVYDFLRRLGENNNREWFEANKKEYVEIQSYFESFVAELIKEIAEWDPDIDPGKLKVKDCTYRIYRDIRFSKNKLPYKTHIGAYICKGGKKSPYAGYYLHIEPESGADYIEGNHLFAGLYRPDSRIIHSLRDEISVNGDSFLDAVKKARGFELTVFDALKKVPKGYEDVKPEWRELLKHKDYTLCMDLDEKFLFAPSLAERVSGEFRKTLDFTRVLNLAVQYAIEEIK